MLQSQSKLGFICIVALTLCACKAGLSATQNDAVPNEKARIFGRIKMINVKEQAGIKIYVKKEDQELAVPFKLNEDGYISWNLAPGNYTITSFMARRGWGRIWVEFKVPADDKFIYIGRLEIIASVVSDVTVIDDFESDSQEIIKRFGVEENNLVKHLMHKEMI